MTHLRIRRPLRSFSLTLVLLALAATVPLACGGGGPTERYEPGPLEPTYNLEVPEYQQAEVAIDAASERAARSLEHLDGGRFDDARRAIAEIDRTVSQFPRLRPRTVDPAAASRFDLLVDELRGTVDRAAHFTRLRRIYDAERTIVEVELILTRLGALIASM